MEANSLATKKQIRGNLLLIAFLGALQLGLLLLGLRLGARAVLWGAFFCAVILFGSILKLAAASDRSDVRLVQSAKEIIGLVLMVLWSLLVMYVSFLLARYV